ncbi:MAG: hypothetical protein DRJ52_02375 [Thermoprotei archaeon]|nr:MAG: hypothetical protein DRJ52_02375 [Thermoprotei archaeon]HDI74966.1 hypothetical protein [Thermoprotei archaeon]
MRFVKSLGQSFLGLLADAGGLLAGFMLAYFVSFFLQIRWALAAYPGVLSLRGVVNGIFCGRLSTGLHLGTIRASFRDNTEDFYTLLASVFTLNVVCSLLVSLSFTFFGLSLWGLSLNEVICMWAVLVSSMTVSFALINPITVAFASISYKGGYDPDYLVYPVMSTLGDIVATLCYTLVVSLAKSGAFPALLAVAVLAVIAAAVLSMKFLESDEYFGLLKEGVITLALVTIIVGLTGTILGEITKTIGQYPALYMVYPAVLDTIGDVGSIVGSTLTTKLALGEVSSDLKAFIGHIPEILGTWLASIIMFLAYSIVASLSFSSTYSLYFSLLMLKANIIAISLIVPLSLSTAIISYRYGLDPDNFVNPIVSSIADTLSSLALLVSLMR